MSLSYLKDNEAMTDGLAVMKSLKLASHEHLVTQKRFVSQSYCFYYYCCFILIKELFGGVN
jgi:hypothetical protein